MAQTTSLNLLPTTAYPGPIGTAVSITGDKQQAASYIVASSTLQTFTWAVTDTFLGTIAIQCTLVTDPTETDWFEVYEIDTSTQYSGYHNINGNFVWARAVVTNWTAGTIYQVTINY